MKLTKAYPMIKKVLDVCFVILLTSLFAVSTVMAEVKPKSSSATRYLKVIKGHSYPLSFHANIDTLVIGDPNVIQVSTLKPDLIIISGQVVGSTSLTIFSEHHVATKYVIQVATDYTQLQALIHQIERTVTVDEVGDVIVLKGKVKTAAALTRILTLADRYVSSEQAPDFSVISDKGGVLAGNTDEQQEVEPTLLNLSTQTVGAGGARQSAGRGGGAGGGIARAIRQPLYPGKGNLAQNISRGDVIMVAQGKVMSLIKVEAQPKVEVQMQIVAVDRNKTDELGWDWRITGIKDSGGSSTGITIGGLLGGVSPSIGSGISGTGSNTGTLNVGSSTLASVLSHVDAAKGLTLGLVSFLRLVEEKGAGTTLSEPIITALSGESASFLVGGSLPIPVQSLSAGSATQNAVVATNVSFVQFGLSLIVRPTVLENGNISIVLDQSISEPDYTNAFTLLGTPIPAFKQKTISTLTESASGETWAVAGLLTEEETKKMSEVPFFSQIPVIGQLFKKKNDRVSRNELFIVVNARRVDGVNNTTQNFDNEGRLKPSEAEDAADSEDYIEYENLDELPLAPDVKHEGLQGKEKTTKPASSKKPVDVKGKKQTGQSGKVKQPNIINGLRNNSIQDAGAITQAEKKQPQQYRTIGDVKLNKPIPVNSENDSHSDTSAGDVHSNKQPLDKLDDHLAERDAPYYFDSASELNQLLDLQEMTRMRQENQSPFITPKQWVIDSTRG